MKRLVSVSLALLLVLLVCAGCGGKKAETKEAEKNNDNENTAVFSISTDYAELKFPKKWQDDVDVDVNGDTVKFSVEDVPLFDIVFNGEEGFILGTITEGNTETVVRLIDHSLDAKSSVPKKYNEMQKDVNVIVEYLSENYDFSVGEGGKAQDNEDVFEIETSLTTLYYPTKWKDLVTVKTDDNSVRFVCGDVKLFDLLFNSNKGNLIGSYNGTTISIVDYDINENEHKKDIYFDLCEMQIDVNVILQHLMEDESFIIS